jgi:hypothetical protein
VSTTKELIDALNNAAFNLENHHMAFPHYDEIVEIVRTRDSRIIEAPDATMALANALELAQFKALGTVEHYAELVKAEQQGRVAECTCGECKCEEMVEGGKNYCSQFGIACIGGCLYGERREGK